MGMIKYWDLDDAIEELKRRQNVAEEIESTYNFSWLPKLPQGKFYGFLARHIATACLEELQFFKRCSKSGLVPLWLEYLDDMFCTNNPDKIRLIKLRVFLGRGRKGGIKEKVIRIVDYYHCIGSSIKKLTTYWGEPLYEFHHRVLKYLLGSVQIIDNSEWYKSLGGRAINYYESYLALSIAHGVLFESFEISGFPGLEQFKCAVVLPAYRRLMERWKLHPLIVYHPWPREEEFLYLNYYPPEILRFIPEMR